MYFITTGWWEKLCMTPDNSCCAFQYDKEWIATD